MRAQIEDEYDTYNRERKWEQVFNRLHNEAGLLHNHTCKDARKLENRERNRYRDVHPFDHTRVKLQGCSNDYINASLITVPAVDRRYILTQGPLPNTCGHLWKMVWQQGSKGIIMLNKILEKGDVKCHQYYPEGTEKGDMDDVEFPDVGIRVELVSSTDLAYYVIRVLRLVDTQTLETRIVTQFHYVTWPDFGVPQSPNEFLEFLKVVRKSGCLEAGSCGPPIVHCSAGIGRSGTFCLVDCALLLVSRTRSTNNLNLRSMLMEMRQCRAGLVQTADQLRFCYSAVRQGAHRILVEEDDLGYVPVAAGSQDFAGSNGVFHDDRPSPTQANRTHVAQLAALRQDTVVAAPADVPTPGDEELIRLRRPPPLPQRTSSLLRSSQLPKSLSLDDRASCSSSPADAAAVQAQPASDGDSASGELQKRRQRPQEEAEEEAWRHLDSPTAAKQQHRPPEVTVASGGGGDDDDTRLTGDSASSPIELRRRKREERAKNTAEQIQRMRKKQQECERLRGQRRGWYFPSWVNIWTVSLSVAAVAVFGGYMYYNYF